jgi:hypothetical protein
MIMEGDIPTFIDISECSENAQSIIQRKALPEKLVLPQFM